MMLPRTLWGCRILTYGYDAYPMQKSVASLNRLRNHAENLLKDLTDDRTVHGSLSHAIIFVAHSLSGLVCKETILQSRDHPDPHLQDVFDYTKGIVFMGTPHKGAWLAD
jgi:protein SERAC1